MSRSDPSGRVPRPWVWLAVGGLGLALLGLTLVLVADDGPGRPSRSDRVARQRFCAALEGDYDHHLDLAGGERWGDGSSEDLRQSLATFSYPDEFVRGAPGPLRPLADRVRHEVLATDLSGRDRERALAEFEELVKRSTDLGWCPTA